MEANPCRWFEIYVRDIGRAKKFYESVLSVKLEKLDSPGGMDIELWAFPMFKDKPGASGALVKMEGVEPGNNSTLIYFASSDCSNEAGRAAEAGGAVFKEKFSIGQYGYIALLGDTEGNMFGVHSLE